MVDDNSKVSLFHYFDLVCLESGSSQEPAPILSTPPTPEAGVLEQPTTIDCPPPTLVELIANDKLPQPHSQSLNHQGASSAIREANTTTNAPMTASEAKDVVMEETNTPNRYVTCGVLIDALC